MVDGRVLRADVRRNQRFITNTRLEVLMFFPMRKSQKSLHSNYAKRMRKTLLHSIPQVGFECLEQRIVLSVDPSLVVLSTTQIDALSSGLTSLAQRLTEAQAADMLASSAAGIGQPLGTVISF